MKRPDTSRGNIRGALSIVLVVVAGCYIAGGLGGIAGVYP